MSDDDPIVRTVSYFTCSTCKADNLDVDACVECGAPAPGADGESDTDGVISISLSFSAMPCPDCGLVQEAGACSACGADVPPPDDIAAGEQARVKALSPLLEEALALDASFDFPDANVTVATDQYISALNDAELFDQVLEILEFGHGLRDFDFSDAAVVGGDVRRQIVAHLRAVAALRAQTARLAWFAPPEHLAPLRALLLGTGRYGAKLAVETLNILTSTTPSEAQAAAHRWQVLLAHDDEATRFSGLFELARETYAPDLNERVEVALGLRGWFLDDLGMVDPARIFAAAGAEGDAIERLVVGAGGFFSHLLDTPVEDLGAESAGLALTAIALATADRPFSGHRVAREVRDLLDAAERVDRGATHGVVAAVEENGARAFAAALRMQREVRLLATGQLAGVEDVVIGLVRGYKGLAESSYRTLGSAVVDLQDIAAGKTPQRERLMLGALGDRVRSSGGAAGEAIADAVHSGLRNAEAHEDYRVEDDGSVVFFEDGARLTVDELDEAIERLSTITGGLQAAITCFGVDWALYESAPAWIRRGDLPAANELLIRALLGMFGFDPIDVTVGEAVEFTLSDPPPTALALLTPVVGIAQLAEGADVFRALDQHGNVLLECPAKSIRAYADAPSAAKDLAVLVPIYALRLRSGHSPCEAFLETLTLMLNLVVQVDVPRIVGGKRDEMRNLDTRLAYIAAFASEYGAPARKKTDKVLNAVSMARAAAGGAARGDGGAYTRLASQLGRIENWIRNRGVPWPPI